MIRRAKREDSEAILRMMKALFRKWEFDPMDRIDDSWFSSREALGLIRERIDNNACFVAEADGSIVGYVYGLIETRQCLKDKEVGLIDELFVEESYRGKGIGEALNEAMVGWFRKKGAQWTIVLTHKDDDSAKAYWKSRGFSSYNIKYRKKL